VNDYRLIVFFAHLHTTQFFFDVVSASLDVQLSNVHLNHDFVDVCLRLHITPSSRVTRDTIQYNTTQYYFIKQAVRTQLEKS